MTTSATRPEQPQFQSSPVPKDGRYSDILLPKQEPDVFQSSPVPKDGRYGWGT